MKNKVFVVILAIIILTLLAYFFLKPKDAVSPGGPQSEQISKERFDYELPNSPTPTLSLSAKEIIQNGKIILSVDDDAIFAFFKDPKTGFCDNSNINNTPARKSFCTSKETFKSKTSFSKIVSSPTNGAIGFVIETDELTPDTVTGVYFPQNTTYKVHLLTNYYLGNDFISFSPNGSRFVYKEGCFEAVCGFTIKETNTLKTIRHFGDAEIEPSNVFIRWISDSSIEYKVGTDLKTATLN